MRTSNLQQRRLRLGMSIRDLAGASGFTEAQLTRWEQGGRISRNDAALLRWHVDLLERRQALEASGLPECAWMREWDENAEGGAAAVAEWVGAVDAHKAQCAVCHRRDEFLMSHFGPMPEYPAAASLQQGERILDLALGVLDPPSGRRRLVNIAAAVFAVPAVAGLLRYLPVSIVAGALAYALALMTAAVLVINVYASLGALQRRGAAARWMARCLAAWAGTIGAVSVALLAGFGSPFARDAAPVGWREGMALAVVAGVAYATLWPLARHLRPRRSH